MSNRMWSQYLCFISLFWSILLILFSSILASSIQSNGNDALWPLKFHKSPWLEKGFLVREETPHSSESRTKCDENSQQEYGRSSFSSCQAEGECSFTPSPSCRREIERRRFEREEQIISLDRILAHNYINPPTRILSNKDGRKREMPEMFEQCHYLTDALITEMCSSDRQHVRRELIQRFRFRNCRRFSLENSLASDLFHQVIDSKNCSNILRELLMLDNLVEELACEYESILKRYDCDAKWSVKWTCKDCRLAYREWLCSTYIPYYAKGVLIKPCQSICEQVEQKCPHLHPYGKGQYAGEPVFLCIDPNIPFNQEITPDIPFGASGWCYDSCDLEPCLNEHNEMPVVNCEYKLPTTTLSPVEFEDESVQLFEEELENNTNQTEQNNTTDGEKGNFLDESLTSSIPANGAVDSGKLYTLETTTELEWTKDSFVGDSVEVEFEREVQTLRNNGNINDADSIDAAQMDYTTKSSLQSDLTTVKYPSWNSDDDYNYIIQAGPVESAKQSQSIQYLELEPLFKSSESTENVPSLSAGIIGVTQKQSQTETKQAPDMTLTTSTTEAFQEIFERALSPTRATSLDSGAGAELDTLKELILNEDDIQAVQQSTEVRVDDWRNRPNQQIIYSPSTTVRGGGDGDDSGLHSNGFEDTTVTDESVGLNHYRHSRSHRAANKNSVALKQQQQQKEQSNLNRFRNIQFERNSFSISQSIQIHKTYVFICILISIVIFKIF